MVANPPWVRLSNIQDRPRKDGVERLARKLHLWVGGKNATGFNMAALFVAQCAKIYGAESLVSGWVLPDAAMRGSNWAGYVKAVKPPVVWDLGGLPFPKHGQMLHKHTGYGQAAARPAGDEPGRASAGAARRLGRRGVKGDVRQGDAARISTVRVV